MPAAAPPAFDLRAAADRLRDECASVRSDLAEDEDCPPDARTAADDLAAAAAELSAGLAATPPRSAHDLINFLAAARTTCHDLLDGERTVYVGRFQTALEHIAADIELCVAAVKASRTAEPPAPGPAEPAAPPPAPRPATTGTILLVEDDHVIRQGIARELRADGHDVWELADGRNVARLTAHVPFDLVLLDNGLPGTTGFEVLTVLRANPRLDAVPVVMLSADDQVAQVVKCIKAGANDYLTKPVHGTLLRAKVNSFLQRRRQKLKELEQFFAPVVARRLIDDPGLLTDARDAVVTVLFCDIRGFSRISERLGTTQTLTWVRAVMDELSEAVIEQEGVLVDYIGDELMAMWGAPTAQPDHATRACRAALGMVARLDGLNAAWRDRLGEDMDVGIGVNTGLALVGNTGTARKFKYGPLGSAVNVASRIQGATKYLKTRLLVSQTTLDQIDRTAFASRRLADVRVVNVREPLRLHEVAAVGTDGWEERKARYERALRHYEARELDAAAEVLCQAISAHGPIGPEFALMARTMEAMVTRDRWAAVFDLPGK